MKKRYIFSVVALILITIIYVGYFDYATLKEIKLEIIAYDEAPKFVKDKLNAAEIIEVSTLRIEENEGPYLVIIPPKDKAVDVLYVGRDESMGGFMYKYTYKEKVGEGEFDNIRIIKINHYNGEIRGVFVSNREKP